MQWVFTLVILLAFGAAEFSPTEPVDQAGLRCALVAGSASTVVLLAAAFAWLMVSSGAIGISLSARKAISVRLGQLHASCWLLACGVIYLGLGWTQLVRQNWRLADAVLIDEALILLPAVASILLSWLALEVVHRSRQPSDRQRFVGPFLRLICAPILLPVFVLVTVQDVARTLGPPESSGQLATPTAIIALVAIVLLLPGWICRLWGVRRLESQPLRNQLDAVGRNVGFSPRDILCVPSHLRLVNAAATGVLPRRQYVLIGQALVDHLSTDELESVYRHELGHLALGHLHLRLLAIVTPLLLWIAAGSHGSWLVLLSGACVSFVLLAVYSRLLEHEADLFACDTASDTDGIARSSKLLIHALEKMTSLAGRGPRCRSVLHPSLVARARFLSGVSENVGRRWRFRLLMRVLACSLVATSAAMAILAAV